MCNWIAVIQFSGDNLFIILPYLLISMTKHKVNYVVRTMYFYHFMDFMPHRKVKELLS